MTIDTSTLTLAGGIVSVASGLFLLIHWLHDRAAAAAFWWALANCSLGLGVVLLGIHDIVPDLVARSVTPTILIFSAAITWLAARVFNRGSAGSHLAIYAGVLGLAYLVAASVISREGLAATIGVMASGICYAAAAAEFWLGCSERLPGRWAIVSLLSLQAIALFLTAAETFGSTQSKILPSINWFGIIHFVGLIYAAGSAVFLTAMLKQRSEVKHKAAALTDALTGLPNRRAFTELAEDILRRRKPTSLPVSLVLFDLDHFKSINDQFGHLAGDAVLQIFAEVLTGKLRRTDVTGRLGGEEFAVLLPDCDARVALGKASKIRASFQERARHANDRQVNATVSAGAATFNGMSLTLAEMIGIADEALYQAKASGRNRVAPAYRGQADPENVVRIA